MKKNLLIIFSLFISTSGFACSCEWGGNFIKTAKKADLVLTVKVIEENFHLDNGKTFHSLEETINETLFHWQSQNLTSPESPKGLSYINQDKESKKILLFVRESKKDADGFTQGYVFIGPSKYVEHKGSKPMSIKWKLNEPIPHYLWKESAKLSAG